MSGITVSTRFLTKKPRTSHILLNLKSEAFILIGKLCDDVCIDFFKATHVNVKKGVSVILEINCTNNCGIRLVNLYGTHPPPHHSPRLTVLNELLSREILN